MLAVIKFKECSYIHDKADKSENDITFLWLDDVQYSRENRVDLPFHLFYFHKKLIALITKSNEIRQDLNICEI